MKVALVLHGDEPEPDVWRLLDTCDAVVCADGAAMGMLRAERPPTVIVGDLDSLDSEAYKWADALDVPIERHPKDKDETDGELALRKAMEMGATHLLVLGAHGGRTGQFLGNLHLLRRAHEAGLEARIVGHREVIRFISAPDALPLAGRTGWTINLLPWGGPAVVHLDGTHWEGRIELAGLANRGMSNKILQDGANVRVEAGSVIVVLERFEAED